MSAQVKFFGQYLISRGLVPEAAVAEAVAHQAAVNLPLGAIALQKGMLSERQVLAIHTEQKKSDRRFGELAVDLGFLTRTQVDRLLAEQQEAHVLLGEALVATGHLTREALGSAFEAYGKEQQQAAASARAALAAAPRTELVQLAADLTCRMLLRMGRLVAKVRAVTPGGELPAHDRVFSQRVGGERRFLAMLALSDPDALGVARSMLEPLSGEDELPSSVDALVLDVGKELINIIVGQVCSRLSRDDGARGLEPEPPDVDRAAPACPPGDTRVVVELALPHGSAAFAIDVPK